MTLSRNGRSLLMTALILIGSLFLCSPSGAETFTKLVVFGDSLSDRGNLNRVDPTQPVVWSDGDNWIDYLSRRMEITGDNLVNHAHGGALTSGHLAALALAGDGDPTNDARIPTFAALGFAEQVAAYVAAAPTVDSAATLFVFWIGGNDIASYISRSLAGDTTLAAETDYIATATARVGTAMEQLASVGARNFLILNIADVSKAPTFLATNTATQAQVSQFVTAFNTALDREVDATEATYEINNENTNLTIFKYDTHALVTRTLGNRTFPNITWSYVILDEQLERTTQTRNEPVTNFFWWDGLHPTARAYEILATDVAVQFSPALDPPSSGGSDCFLGELLAF